MSQCEATALTSLQHVRALRAQNGSPLPLDEQLHWIEKPEGLPAIQLLHHDHVGLDPDTSWDLRLRLQVRHGLRSL